MQDIKAQTGRLTGELKTGVLPVPYETAHVWEWFTDLETGRQSGMGGLLPLTWADLDAYFRLHRVRPEPWEVDTIRALDAEFLASQASDTTEATTTASELRKQVNEPAANRSRRR